MYHIKKANTKNNIGVTILSRTCRKFFFIYADLDSPNILILASVSNMYMIKIVRKIKIAKAPVCRKLRKDKVLSVALVGENIW